MIPPKRRADRTNRTDKTVAAAGFGPDEIAVLAEGLAQCGYLRPQIDLFHGPTGPYPPHQLVLADQRSVGLEQNQQEIESPSPHWTSTPSASNSRRRRSTRYGRRQALRRHQSAPVHGSASVDRGGAAAAMPRGHRLVGALLHLLDRAGAERIPLRASSSCTPLLRAEEVC